jgi:hypothetical protein
MVVPCDSPAPAAAPSSPHLLHPAPPVSSATALSCPSAPQSPFAPRSSSPHSCAPPPPVAGAVEGRDDDDDANVQFYDSFEELSLSHSAAPPSRTQLVPPPAPIDAAGDRAVAVSAFPTTSTDGAF